MFLSSSFKTIVKNFKKNKFSDTKTNYKVKANDKVINTFLLFLDNTKRN